MRGLLLLGIFVLSWGCSEIPEAKVTVPSTFDGRWVGRYSSSIGLITCPSQGLMELSVRSGEIMGVLQTEGAFQTIQGFVTTAGAVRDTVFVDRTRAVAEMTGSFGEKGASGRWIGPTCEGTWQIWRFGDVSDR